MLAAVAADPADEFVVVAQEGEGLLHATDSPVNGTSGSVARLMSGS